jgi:hypothetical protein
LCTCELLTGITSGKSIELFLKSLRLKKDELDIIWSQVVSSAM